MNEKLIVNDELTVNLIQLEPHYLPLIKDWIKLEYNDCVCPFKGLSICIHVCCKIFEGLKLELGLCPCHVCKKEDVLLVANKILEYNNFKK